MHVQTVPKTLRNQNDSIKRNVRRSFRNCRNEITKFRKNLQKVNRKKFAENNMYQKEFAHDGGIWPILSDLLEG